MKNIRPRTALAFQEDARAIASWARDAGFLEDAEAMQRFAQRLDPYTAPLTVRWARHKEQAS